jgi:murein DD-endopeptidase MepM/ murein hydrolase activator NlpD
VIGGILVRIFLAILLLSTLGVSTGTDKKIKSSKRNLNRSVAQQKKVNRQLDKIAKDIQQAQDENLELNKKLAGLSQEYAKNETLYKKSKDNLTKYNKNLVDINRDIEEKKEKFVSLLAHQFSIIHAMNQSHEASRESIIKQEIYQLYKIQNAQELKLLGAQISRWKKQKKRIIKESIILKKKINALTKQRDEYTNRRKQKQSILDKLSSSEIAYRKILQQSLDKQDALRSTLADLNIIHKKEVAQEKRRIAIQKEAMLKEERRKKAERKARKLARAKARKSGEKVVYNTKPRKAKKSKNSRGSSYQKNKIYAYRGGKTISPLPGARVIKSFGTYVDPIYKIKIFNESVTLKAPNSNAKVYNVLNGKVVFAGVSSMLGRVVVVAHGSRMHTVYAGLSKIAPNLRKGSRIQKGYVIGKVSKKLIFEATKNSKHINPMRLIRI